MTRRVRDIAPGASSTPEHRTPPTAVPARTTSAPQGCVGSDSAGGASPAPAETATTPATDPSKMQLTHADPRTTTGAQTRRTRVFTRKRADSAHDRRTRRHGGARDGRQQRDRRGDGAGARARGAAVAIGARRKERLDALAEEIEQRRRHARSRSRPTSPTRTQVRDLVAPHGRRASGGWTPSSTTPASCCSGRSSDAPVEEWDRMIDAQPQGAAVRRPRRAAAPARCRRGRSAPRRRPREHQLRRGPRRAQGLRRLQPHQARRRRVQRVAAPGGDRPPRARLARRARRRRHRAARPHPRRDPRASC